jgi:hypothetical protein
MKVSSCVGVVVLVTGSVGGIDAFSTTAAAFGTRASRGPSSIGIKSNHPSPAMISRSLELRYRENHKPFECPVEPEDTVEDLERDATDAYIQDVVSQVTSNEGGDIIRKYKPQRSWLWGRWNGTLLQHGIKKVWQYAMVSIQEMYAC